MMFKRFLQALMMAALLFPAPLWAGTLQQSLNDFFAQGIHYQGAKAELVKVIRWPKAAKGVVRWELPRINRHTAQLSLIAEQGEGSALRRWYVPVQLRWWANVVTVRQELPTRSLLQASMLQIERKNVAGHTGTFWGAKDALLGMRLTRPLHVNDVVFSHMVKRPPLIQRGDRITIVAGNGSFSVRAEGQAMKAASIGERILVQNMRSKERVQAIVIDAHTVRVHI